MAADETPLLLRQPLVNLGRSDVADDDVQESPPLSPELCTQPVPRALAGVMVYVEVRSTDSRENRSSAIASELETLGATVCPRFTKDVTHVVFKDGKPSARERAEKNRVFLVSPLWVEACKRANDWISEAKYPVITRDTADASSTPVVLGKIKRIKSMQPKPLEEEIAKSLERRRKRPSRGEGREAEKKRREIVEESSNEMEVEQDSELDLPVINLPPTTPRQPFSVAASNAEVTPFLSANNNNSADKQTNNNSKQTGKQTTEKENNSRQKEVTTSATNKDEDFQEPSSKIATKKNRVGSKVVSKSTKRAVTMKKSTKSTKSTVAAKKRAVALGKVNAKKRVKKTSGGKPTDQPDAVSTESPSAKQTTSTQGVVGSVGKKKKRRSNNSRPFTRDLPGLVMTSVSRGDQELVLSVVKKLGRFTVIDMVEDTTTHVVCGRGRRTVNVLSATVRGCWVLSLDWVCQSLEAGRWLEEEKFEMTDSFPSAKYFREEREEAGHLYRSSLFKEAGSVCVSPSTSPPALQLEMLLVAGGANVSFFAKFFPDENVSSEMLLWYILVLG
ncbi:Microcephalin [Geodia barretti]|uniref:Microcephalin n=2 Tax=Geodia barretti TaxID=519541 RepID=A0AA35S7G5_GEOBA|nr:Microcephalin [Geodia barretti]